MKIFLIILLIVLIIMAVFIFFFIMGVGKWKNRDIDDAEQEKNLKDMNQKGGN